MISTPTQPTIYLASVDTMGAKSGIMSLGAQPGGIWSSDFPDGPAILVSYHYMRLFQKHDRSKWAYRHWVMDSGAFSAHNSGVTIDINQYIEDCKRLRGEDVKLKEIFSLDVIGDWKASLQNTKRMWKAGIEVIPCFHFGGPWDVLKGLAADYPKIALGGLVSDKQCRIKRNYHYEWVDQCFARIWPKRVHGFGCTGRKLLNAVPFDSADSTNWRIGPVQWGQWETYGTHRKVSIRGEQGGNLRSEVEWYLRLERRMRSRWAGAWKAVAHQI
jgi:hypothetical protein